MNIVKLCMDIQDERFEFCGQELTFTDTVVHLGHTLSCDLSDSEDIKTKDFIRCANCLLASFGVCSSVVKSCLLQSFGTSFYGVAYGNFNKILQRIWYLPYCSQRADTQYSINEEHI